jgi:hypothetical protein
MSIAEHIDRATIQAERINKIAERNLDSTSAITVQKLARDIIQQQVSLSEELATAAAATPVVTEKDYGFLRTEQCGDKFKVTFKGKKGKLAAGLAVGGMLGLGVFALIRGLR